MIVAGIVLGALAVRLLFIAETAAAPGFAAFAPGLDLDLHWRAADHLLDGRATYELASLSAPGFAYALAAWKAIAGGDLVVFRCAAAVIGALRIALVLHLAARLGAPRWARAAIGAVLALLPSLIYFDTMPIKVGAELTLLALALLAATARGRAAVCGALAGAALALLALHQLSAIAVAAPIALYLALDRRTRAGAAALLAVVVTVALGWRTCTGPDRFLPRAGVDLAIAFRPGAEPTYRALPGVPATPFGHAFGARIALEAQLGRAVSPAEADAAYRDRAIAHVRAHPAGALAIAARRAAYFVRSEELPDDHALALIRETSIVARLGPPLGLLIVLAVLGAIQLARRDRRTLLLLGGVLAMQVAACMLTHVTWRYRLPAVIPLAALASFGAAALAAARRQPRALARLALPAALAAAATWWPVAERDALVEAARAGEQWARAAEADATALAHAPAGTIDRALLLHRLGRATEARDALAALIGAPSRPTALAGEPSGPTGAPPPLRPDAAAIYLGYLAADGDYARARALLAAMDPREAARVHAALPREVAGAIIRVTPSRSDLRSG